MRSNARMNFILIAFAPVGTERLVSQVERGDRAT
jgi:hypothetical protein